MYPGLTHDSDHTGIFVQEQVGSLQQAGVDVDVLTISGSRSRLSYLTSIFMINRRLRNDPDIDLIHVHYGLSGLFLLFNYTFPKSRIVITYHGSDIAKTSKKYIQRMISRLVAHRARHLILVNSADKSELRRVKSRIHVLPCGVDTEFFQPSKTTSRAPIVVFPSSPSRPEKNYQLFLKVFNLLRQSNPGLEHICLDGMDREEVRNALRESSLVLMTSTSEGSPQVVKEALACNTPVVSVNVGDVSRLLGPVQNCFVSREYQTSELASLCQEALNLPNIDGGGPARLKDLGLDSRSTAEKILCVYNEAYSE